jgi:uncharacterized protein YhfF
VQGAGCRAAERCSPGAGGRIGLAAGAHRQRVAVPRQRQRREVGPATAGALQFDYEEGEPVEVVGEKMALVGNLGEHVATIQITRVDIARFAEVTDEFALAEDEGDLTGDDFRKSHYDYWTSCGYEINDDTVVVCAYFDLIEDLR